MGGLALILGTWIFWGMSGDSRRPPQEPGASEDDYSPEPVTVPIDGNLDLHTFDPRDVGDLVPSTFVHVWSKAFRRPHRAWEGSRYPAAAG
jgi:hypothetical protein